MFSKSKFLHISLLLVVMILFYPCINLQAAVGVGGIKTLGVNTAGATSDPFLSSSRYRGGINGDTLVFHIAQFGRNQPAWFYSYDRGVTWDSAVTILDDVYSLWYMDYHSNGWYNGNSGFHTAWRYRTSATRPLYRHIPAPYTPESMTDPVRILGLPTDLSYYPVVCANDSEQFYLNLMADINSPIIVYHSTDNFETYTRTEPRHFTVTSGGTTQNGMRANIQMCDDGRPAITILDVGTHAFYRLKWDGTIWDSTMITNQISGLSERGYAYAEMNGKGHLVFMRDIDNKWFHYWDSGGSTWAVDSTLSTVNWTGLGAQQLSVINSGANARLYLFYMIQEGINNNIVLKTWTETDGWDIDSTLIVESAQCTWPQVPPYVPAGQDSVAVIWKSNATNLVYEVNVEAIAAEVGDTIPPSQIIDLQLESVTDSTITLKWTAPGADQDTGSASLYDLRYSLSEITQDNWNLAIPVDAEPIPLVAGTSQSYSVENLSPATTYYFAISAGDESDNWSDISNIVQGTTTSDTIAPAQIVNLMSVVGTADSSIDLSWTSVGDDSLDGTANSYIIRYSQDSITDINWDLAITAVGVPLPMLSGTGQTCTITGMNLATTYYFAMKTGDESDNWSPLSNITSTTTPPDTFPPAQITNLFAIAGSADSTIDLSWTAPGDDNLSGIASSYIIRYSSNLITDLNWALATPIDNVPAPMLAGTIQSCTVTGLNPEATYYFAMMTVDESNNFSVLSNVPSATTNSVADIIAPIQITNLDAVTGLVDGTIDLTWTAPGDDQNVGTASQYDIRYSTSIITLANWDIATSVDAEPTPFVSGTEQSFTVSGLNQATTYYFAMMTADESDNWSELSNVSSAVTLSDITAPAQITDLQATAGFEYGSVELSWTAPGDDQNIGTASMYDMRYSLSPITPANWDLATIVAGLPTPLPSGANQNFSLNNLQLGTTYYFAMMTADESDNWSLLSNVTSVTTTSDTIPPAQISNLLATTGTIDGTINISWTAPGDDNVSGTASSYVIKYSLDPITDLNWDLATDYNSNQNPFPAGSVENATIGGLNPGDTYYVGIKSIDEVGNESALSNISSAQAYLFSHPTVSEPLAVGYSLAGHALLGSPSYRGGRQGDTLIMVSAQFGSNQTGWTVSYDRGNTWQDVRARWMTAFNGGFQTWYSTDHSTAWLAGGLHLAFRGYAGTDPAGYRYIASPYSSETDMETVDFPTSGIDTYYPTVVANGADDVWFFDISEGSSRNNLRYWHTTDRFATSTIPQRVCDIAEDPQNNWRMGAIMGANGYPKVSIFKFDGGFSIWTYNPSTQTFDSSIVISNSIGGLGRSYAHAEMNGLDHIVYTSGWRGSLVHFYETSDGVFDSTIISSSALNSYDPQLSVYGEGASAKLYVAYLTLDSAICVKGWTQLTGWDSDSIVVTGPGHVAIEPAMVPKVPSSWGFLPIWYHELHDNNIYFVKMYQSSPTVSDRNVLAGFTTVISENINDDSASAKIGENDILDDNLPVHFGLAQNYPNPFNPTTEISFSLPKPVKVVLEIFNIQGQKVDVLESGSLSAGTHTITWDASTKNSGIYFYRLTAGEFVATKKMVLLK